MTIVDHAVREDALHPGQSFIVQAPAGSGKTALIIQRYLNLLAYACTTPEEIIAITFTRQAAAEMRSRIIQALKNPNNDRAKAALKQNATRQWGLLENPNRLRIMTIDALCASLVRQMPLLCELSAHANVTDDPRPFYQLAVKELLQGLYEPKPWTQALSEITLHVGNAIPRLTRLFIDMLQRRDQWLPYLAYTKFDEQGHRPLRERLESGLQAVINDACLRCEQTLPQHLLPEMLALEQFSRDQLGIRSNLDSNDQWFGRINLYLTSKGEVRKNVTLKQGFPPPSQEKDKLNRQYYKAMKERFTCLLKALKSEINFTSNLHALRLTPSATYTETQWKILDALLTVLPVLAAQLKVVFDTHNTTDFSAVTQAAIQALGSPEQPTDLALNLDYKIRHLLIDEFQDTSFTQYRLIEQLIESWLPNDGRTLFLVGDPMQSIYRFRQAEVGLFLQVKHRGIAQLRPNALTLSTNFRSTPELIEWFNRTFTQLFPAVEDADKGAITYTPATPPPFHLSANKGCLAQTPATQYHRALSAEDQAWRVADIIKQANQRDPTGTVAVLVYSRTHLITLLPYLQASGIAYQGVDIEQLSKHPVIQDLFALTSALLHLGDRLAWLSILRAPWCELSLADLCALAGGQYREAIIWERLLNYTECAELSDEGKRAIQQQLPVLQAALDHRERLPLADWVQGCWEALNGPAYLLNAAEVNKAEAYFDLLRTLSSQKPSAAIDAHAIKRRLLLLYAPSNLQAQTNVKIMTLHKAKGLEFDTVILPGLERITRQSPHPLLRWMERERLSEAKTDLLLAPIMSAQETDEPIYQYLSVMDRLQHHNEYKRLLYVAATRAKQSLHLVATLPALDEEAGASATTVSSQSPLSWLVESGLWVSPPSKHD